MADPRTADVARSPGGLTHRERARVVAGVLLAYLGLSFVAGDAYPFSTFPMYAESPREPWASHLLALDERGVAHEVTDFAGYRCDHAPEVRAPFCGAGRDRRVDYLDAEAARVLASPAPGAGPSRRVRVVRRGWNLASPDVTLDCAIATCEARAR